MTGNPEVIPGQTSVYRKLKIFTSLFHLDD
jgi:hypothetical protein